MSRNIVIAMCSVAIWAGPATASADVKDCVANFESGQVARKDGRLKQALAAFNQCAASTCPDYVQGQCSKWVDEVEHLVPSVIFDIKVNGDDQLEARVDMDGAMLADHLDVHGISIDPGAHVFKVTVANFEPVEKKVIVREGERLKSVQFVFGTDKSQSPSPTASASVAPSASVAQTPRTVVSRPVPVGVWVLGAVGIVGLASMGTFWALGKSQQNSDESGCHLTTGCSDSEVNSIHTKYLIGDISLAVGGVALAGSLIWYLVRPSHEQPATVSVMPGIGFWQVRVDF
jgi:hypothetical protein